MSELTSTAVQELTVINVFEIYGMREETTKPFPEYRILFMLSIILY